MTLSAVDFRDYTRYIDLIGQSSANIIVW